MTPALVLVGALSVYAPNDGHNHGRLACGGRLEATSRHVAIRSWRGLCGAPVRVCAQATGRCAWTTVRDSGPWGLTCGRGRGASWRVWTRHAIPAGCRRRAVADLTRALWVELGRPRFLSEIRVEIFRRGAEVTS